MKPKIIISFLITIAFFSQIAQSEVISLDDGSILLGEIKNTNRDSVVINSFGDTRTIDTSKIISSEKNFINISKKNIEIILKDSSRLKGKLKNYDEEIGILIDTEFGTITLPSKGIKSINDTDRKNRYTGHSVLLGISAAVYFPITDFASKFTIYPYFSLFAEFNSLFLRGLYFGADFSYMMMNYTPSTLLIYNSYQFKGYASYRFLQFQNSESAAARMFIPYISFGIGAAFNTLDDNRPASSIKKRSEADLLFTGAVGLDINVWGPLIIRLQGGWFTMNEGSAFLHGFSVNLGVVAGF